MKDGFKSIGKEFSEFILGIGRGFGYIFVKLPKKILGLDKNKPQQGVNQTVVNPMDTTNSQNPSQMVNPNQVMSSNQPVSSTQSVNPNKMIEEKQGLVSGLSKKIDNWYNNLPSVKSKAAKLEASLVPYVLDKEKDSIKSDTKHMYEYLARNSEGKLVKDYFPAFSVLDVYSYLTDEKMIVYSIKTSKTIDFLHGDVGGKKSKMRTKDMVFWLAQLSTYIKAGIPLTDAVKVLSQQDKRKKYKGLYEAIIYELTMGQTFSEALAKQEGSFPALLINMIKSAEMTGSIEDTLDEMSAYYQEVEDTKKAIISAMAYPSIVLLFAIVIVVFMLTFIVPKFVDVYASMGSDIPKITQVTLDISGFLQEKWYFLVIGIVIIVTSYILLFKNVKEFRKMMQTVFMKLPVVGQLIVSKEMSMFARTFASLQKNNVLLTDSIDILAKITSNEIYKELEFRTIDNLIKGNKMSETFKNHWAIPDVAYFMIVTGESTGELAEMLDKVADFYQKQQQASVGMIKTFIEPLMILFLAIVVGFILVAILVPMFGIYSTVA